MITEIETALEKWRDDSNILAVVIDAEGEKAFCAGGDLKERNGMSDDKWQSQQK